MEILLRFRVLLLATLVPRGTFANVFPRQTAFTNSTSAITTSSSTSTGTGTSSVITSGPLPAPCCWIAAGAVAVGLNKWYNSSVEEEVATVITTFLRDNHTAIPVNSTTIYKPKNATAAYEIGGFYGAAVGGISPWVTIPGVPTNLITAILTGGGDYDGTSVISGTVQTFSDTDLRITSPTPFDRWFKLAIYTQTPDMTYSPPATWSTYPMSLCGTYATDTLYSYGSSTIISGTSTSTSYTFTPTATTRGLFVPMGISEGAVGGLIDQGSATYLNATYVHPKTSQVNDGDLYLPMPTEVVPWLGSQEHVVAQYPYVTNCWILNGEGEPTVHIPVTQLTAQSTQYIDVAAVATTTKPTVTTINGHTTAFSPVTQPTDTSLDTPTLSPVTEQPGTTLESPTPSPVTEQPGTTLQTPKTTVPAEPNSPTVAPQPAPTTKQGELSLLVPAPATNGGQTSQVGGTSAVQPVQPAQPVETTGNGQPSQVADTSAVQHTQPAETTDVSPLVSAINSIGNQQTTQAGGSAAPVQTQPAATTNIGNLISAINSVGNQQSSGGGSSPNAQPTAGAQDTTVQPAPAASQGEQTTRQAASVGLPAPAQDETTQAAPAGGNSVTGFVVGSETASPGGSAVTSAGSTFSALPSGSGLQVAANGQTSTVPAQAPSGNSPAVQSAASSGFSVAGTTVTPGGSAVVQGGSTFSALQSGSGVQVVANGQTSTIPAVAASAAPVLQPAASNGVSVAGTTITPGGGVATQGGSTFSALPSGSGAQVIANGQTSTIPASAVASAALVYQPVGSNGISVAGTTITPGGAVATQGGSTFSALPSGSGVQVVANGQTSTINAAPPTTPAVQAAGSSGYVVLGSTIAPGSAITAQGTTYSALPSGSGVQIVANGATSTVQAASAGVSVQAAGSSGYVVAGSTLSAGGSAITEAGTTYSALPSGSGVQIIANGQTSTAVPGSGPSITPVLLPGSSGSPSASITVGSEALPYQSLSSNVIVIGSATLTAGGSAVTESGETLSLVTQGSSLALVVDGTSTQGLPTSVPGEQVVTTGGQIYTAYSESSSIVVIDGQTLSPGAVTVIEGQTVSLSGSHVVVATQTATSSDMGGAIISGLGGSSATSAPSSTPTSGAGRMTISCLSAFAAILCGLALLP